MSWIAKAENLLNKIDQGAAIVLQQKDEAPLTPLTTVIQQTSSLPKVPSSKNILVLSKVTPNKAPKNEQDEKWETMSETAVSRRSSISSRHETVIDKSENQKMIESTSTASLNSFSVEKELTAAKIAASELRSENIELKGELESLMEQVKMNGDSMKIQELEELCSMLTEEKKELTVM